MLDQSGRCAPVRCVSKNGTPLVGYVRDAEGNCVPKDCGKGYVFNYATGKCVRRDTREGINLLAIKKYNDACRARDEADAIIRNYKPRFEGDEHQTYGQMLGGTDTIAAAQKAFQDSRRKHEADRDRQYAERLRKAAEQQRQMSSEMAPHYPAPCGKSSSPWASFW